MSCSLYFGLPGSGKSTYCCKLAVDIVNQIQLKRTGYKYVFSNLEINYPGVYKLQPSWLGDYYIHDAALLIDEATLFADCRDYKSFDYNIKQYVLLHRHCRVDIYWFAQSSDSLDKRIREITDRVYYVHKGTVRRWMTYVNSIDYNIAIPGHKDPAGDILHGYNQKSKWAKLLDKRFNRKPYYKYFDSFDISALASRPEVPYVLYVSPKVIDPFQDNKKGIFVSVCPSDP